MPYQTQSPTATLPRLSSLPISKTIHRTTKGLVPLPLPPLSPSLESPSAPLLTPTTPTQPSSTGLVLPPLASQTLPPMINPSTSMLLQPQFSHQHVGTCSPSSDRVTSTVTSLKLPPHPPSPPHPPPISATTTMATNQSLPLPISPEDSGYSTHHYSLIQRLRDFTAPLQDNACVNTTEGGLMKHEILYEPVRAAMSDPEMIQRPLQKELDFNNNNSSNNRYRRHRYNATNGNHVSHQQSGSYTPHSYCVEQYSRESAPVRSLSQPYPQQQEFSNPYSQQHSNPPNYLSQLKQSPLSPLSPQRIPPTGSYETPECTSTQNSNNADFTNNNIHNCSSTDSTNTKNAVSNVCHNQRNNTVDDRPHACRKCNASFRRRDNLTAHVRAQHKGERPFRCEVCGFRFIKKDHAMKHWKVVHLKERPFICAQCDSRFGQRSDLNKHFRSVHLRIKPFKCDHCGLCFSHRGNQIRHQAVVHEKKKPFACVHCSFTFAEKSNLLKHCQAVHKSSPGNMLPRTPVPTSLTPPMV